MSAALMYAQNWEDAELEREALAIGPNDDVVAISGGGCTALALLAAGPRRLYVVDRNPAQLQLLRLKLAAVRTLPPELAAKLLGGVPSDLRRELYRRVAVDLDADAGRFWSTRQDQIRRGVISQGRVERYFSGLRWLLRRIHSRRCIEELFEQPTLEAQRRFYRDRWDTKAWRSLFLLTHKRILDRALDPLFYRYVDASDLPRALRQRAERCMTELPMATNHFLSWIFRGRYGDDPAARPLYLQAAGAAAIHQFAERMDVQTADIRDFLRTLPSSSCDKLYLSNVSEWMPENEVAPCFEEVHRVARDGAVVCYRALMFDRPMPQAVACRFEEDNARSLDLARRDRAFVNAAFHVLTVRKNGSGRVDR